MSSDSSATTTTTTTTSKNEPIELVTYMCGGNKFEVPKRYEVKGLIGQGAYGVVWYVLLLFNNNNRRRANRL
jgi:hypothetical protein